MAQDPNIYYNINVVIISNFEGTLDGFTLDKMNKNARLSSANMNYISERNLVINGQRCKEYICTASVNGDNLKDFIYEFVKGKNLYNVTITSLEENFEKTKSNSLAMINTFLLF